MPEAFDLDGTLGAAFLGTLAAAILYGITSVQTFMYFHDYKEDGRTLKGMVLMLWILDTIHLGFTTHGLYHYLVTNFGNYGVLIGPTWTILSQVYITNISTITVRWFFARRVSVLCGRRYALGMILPGIIILLSLVVFANGCGFASRAFVLKTYEKMNEAAAMLYVSFGAAVVADAIIASSLCTLLLKSKTGFKSTDSIVTKLMAFSINTGLLTSLCAVACFVTYAIWPQRFIFMGVYFALSKLYINATLASLNARSSLRSMSYGNSTGPPLSAPIAFPMKGVSSSSSDTRSTSGEIRDTA
ncbi:hypothetical protein BJ165DRAFT_753727 [Panaeolus papilionaceus]|nr:hypothetical protein BJ165DRAFT_753727 [Panaeolus papilionaceus]